MASLLERVIVPVATVEDAETTASAFHRHLSGEVRHVIGVHVIEKGGGAPDKAPLAAREADAETILERLASAMGPYDVNLDTQVLYGTDLVETIVDAIEDADATALVFCPRHAGFVTRLLTGDRARALWEASPVPVLSLPIQEALDG